MAAESLELEGWWLLEPELEPEPDPMVWWLLGPEPGLGPVVWREGQVGIPGRGYFILV